IRVIRVIRSQKFLTVQGPTGCQCRRGKISLPPSMVLGQPVGDIERRGSLAKPGAAASRRVPHLGRKTSCLAIQNGPAQLFRLVVTIGSATPTPTATLTPTTYATDYSKAPSHAGASPDSLALIRPLEKQIREWPA